MCWSELPLALFHMLVYIGVCNMPQLLCDQFIGFTSICETQTGLFIRIHVTVSRHGGTVSEPSYVIKRHVSGYNSSRSNPASSYASSAGSYSSFIKDVGLTLWLLTGLLQFWLYSTITLVINLNLMVIGLIVNKILVMYYASVFVYAVSMWRLRCGQQSSCPKA